MEMKPLRFINEEVEVFFEQAPALEKKPGPPSGFVWRGERYLIVEILSEWHDYERRGRMARNMQPQHASAAEAARLVGRGAGLLPGADAGRAPVRYLLRSCAKGC